MGESIPYENFTDADRADFRRRLDECLEELQGVLARPGFGVGPSSLGAELELYLIDDDGVPQPVNREVITEAADDALTLELNLYNLEYNAPPLPLAGAPFAELERDLVATQARLESAAQAHGAKPIAIGILPTLKLEHLSPAMMTDEPRYRALSREIRRLRGGAFELSIHGAEELETSVDDVTAEGAATSFQLHLRVPPDQFEDCYNAAQAVTPVFLSLAGNSPVFLGRDLWDESRIALFKQAVDYRPPAGKALLPARVTFGDRWITGGPAELFRYEVEHFAPLLPVVFPPNEADVAPPLRELRLHHSTVWRWNRPIYDPAGGGHLRIEFRSMPAGPTCVDMVANAAFAIGLTLGLRQRSRDLAKQLPFSRCHNNFYRSAQSGPDATLEWPQSGGELRPVPARELALELLPTARGGLVAAGVEPKDCDHLLEVIRARAETGRTGARWQRAWLRHFDAEHGREQALRLLLSRYCQQAAEGEPVHRWPLPA